jgi:hypothetical protein
MDKHSSVLGLFVTYEKNEVLSAPGSYSFTYLSRDHIFSRARPFYERAVSDLDRSMHRYLWV